MLRHSFIQLSQSPSNFNNLTFLSFHPQKKSAEAPIWPCCSPSQIRRYSWKLFIFIQIPFASKLSPFPTSHFFLVFLFFFFFFFFVGYTLQCFLKNSTCEIHFFKSCIFEEPPLVPQHTCTHTLLLPSTYLIVCLGLECQFGSNFPSEL